METKELNGNGKIVVARTEIYVPHLGEVLAFSLPMTGPHYFVNAIRAISQDGRLRPTTAQTLSLVNLALQNPNDEHCKDILSKFRYNWFWTATQSLYGKEDIVVYDNTEGDMPSNEKLLKKRYRDGDNAVRIIPYGFQRGRQSIGKLLKHPYIIAQVGTEDMINILESVVRRIKKDTFHVWASNPTPEPVKKYTVLGLDWVVGELCINGNYNDSNRDSCISGMRNASAEDANRRK